MDKRSIFFVALLAICLYFVNWWFGEKVKPAPAPQITHKEEVVTEALTSKPFTPSTSGIQQEQYYVLENGYQQLVFTNVGGALCEINLPLASPENKESVIRSIRFDRIMAENHPINDHFPPFEYYVPGEEGTPPILKPKGSVGGYYPLLRRSILGENGRIISNVEPRFFALNVVSEDPEVAKLTYQLKRFSKNLIEFEATQPERRITKTFSFPPEPSLAPYCIDVTVKVEGDARDLELTTGVPEVELVSGSASPLLKYRTFRASKSQIEKVSLPKSTVNLSSTEPDWISNSNGFMGLILDPTNITPTSLSATYVPGELLPTRLTLIDAKYNLYPAHKYPGYMMHIPLKRSAQSTTFRFFAGPYDNTILSRIDETYTNPTTGASPDFVGVQSFDRWFGFISEPFSKFLLFLMKSFYSLTHSWGFSIILLTVALRIMMYPLNSWSFKSMGKMQKIAPKVQALQNKYKKEPKRAQMEVMNLYRENKVNPLMGCLPMLLQLPFLIGMFDLLKSTFDLRGAPFIPGWIDNLTAPDILFSWKYPIFFIGTSFHLLPILLGAIMYFQQKLSTGLSKTTPVVTDQQKQQKMTGNIMVIVFTVLFYHFPSGLNIYWLSSMILGIFQQMYVNKKILKT